MTGLPERFAQGLFAKLGRYSVAMRFSTFPGDVLDDNVTGSMPVGTTRILKELVNNQATHKETSKPISGRHLYDICVAPENPAMSAVLPPRLIAELARLKSPQ